MARLILGSSMLITAVLASLGVAIMRVNAHQGPGDAEPPDIFAVIGSGEPVLVSQMFLTSCAFSEVTVSLIFPGPPRPGYNRIDEAPRLNARAVRVDAEGAVATSLDVPVEYPGAWLGYVAMEGACVTAGRQQLLARVRVAVPLGGQTARDLGIDIAAGAVVVIPAEAVATYPIMVDDPEKDPYKNFAPVRLVDAAGNVCAEASDPAVDAAGDIVVPVPHDACGEVATLVVGPRNVALVDKAILRAGYAVGMPITWPPPNSGGPLPPAVGSGAPVTTGGDWWVAAVLAVAVVVGTAALAGARWRH
ncbi:MAG: hypothetical protein IH609_03370 [Dehalococcoidia bacterium]|nr:hypothetical protein [Dehalococcoidia bacterium]